MARAGRGARTAAIALVVGSIGLFARAQGEQAVVLQWSAPPDECPDAPYVQAEIARLLGGGASASDSKVAAKAKVAHVKEGVWRVDLSTAATPSGGGAPVAGSRTLEADSCRSLADATALILALTVNPKRVAEVAASASPSSSVAPLPSIAPSTSIAPSASIAPSTTTTSEPTITPIATNAPKSTSSSIDVGVSFMAGGAIDIGSFPVVAVGLAGGAELRLDRLRIDAGLTWIPTRKSTLDAHPSEGGDFDLVSAGGRVGWALVDGSKDRSMEIAPTIALSWSHVRASGVGVEQPNDTSIDLLAFGPGGYVSVPIAAPLFVRLQIEALFPFHRPTFVLENIGDVHAVPAVIGRGTLALELRI
jgi:hypothetical protein